MTTVFTAVAVKNTDETAITNTAATSVKFSSHCSEMSFSVLLSDVTLRFSNFGSKTLNHFFGLDLMIV